MDKSYGFGEIGGPAPEKAAPAKPQPKQGGEPDGDEGVTMHVHKRGHKFHSKVDKHDGYPPDEMDHDSADEAHAAMGEAMKEKYGESDNDGDEQPMDSAPKAGGYFHKAQEMLGK